MLLLLRVRILSTENSTFRQQLSAYAVLLPSSLLSPHSAQPPIPAAAPTTWLYGTTAPPHGFRRGRARWVPVDRLQLVGASRCHRCVLAVSDADRAAPGQGPLRVDERAEYSGDGELSAAEKPLDHAVVSAVPTPTLEPTR